MKFELLTPDQLTTSLREKWIGWLRTNQQFQSPYFHPDFTQVMVSVRDDVKLIQFIENDEIVGILPIHLTADKVALPIGDKLSDYHGVISENPLSFELDEMLKATKIKAFYFDHLVGSSAVFEEYSWGKETSAYIDVSSGYEAYELERKQSKSKFFKRLLSNERKMIREVKDIRFEEHTTDQNVFDRLCELKSQQYQRTQQPDLMAVPWIKESLEGFRHHQTEDFSGILSALYANDELVAIHFGIKTKDVLHWWFPTYNLDYSRYSVGLVLLLNLIRSEKLGLKCLDFGKGDEPYKHSMKSGEFPLLEGAVDQRMIPRMFHQNLYLTKQWAKQSPTGQRSLNVYRKLRSALRK